MSHWSPDTQLLIDLAAKSAPIFKKYYSPRGFLPTMKTDNSPVTICDTEINAMVIAEVRKERPGYGVLGEEESFLGDMSKPLIVVDPLDGTKMFTFGLPLFGFMCAVVVDGRPIAGIIFNPLIPRTIIAEKGKGTWLLETGEQLSVSSVATLSGQYVDTGHSDTKVAAQVHERGGKVLELYAAAETASQIALGYMVGDISIGSKTHDIAAPKIIIEEAGGKVTNIFGEEDRYDEPTHGVIMSNAILHAELVEMAKRAGYQEIVRSRT